MTPTEHATAAAAAVTEAQGLKRTGTLKLAIAEVHAVLSKAAGTGTEYTTADGLLATAEAAYPLCTLDQVAAARVHALMAD